jgi:hypothetical protein
MSRAGRGRSRPRLQPRPAAPDDPCSETATRSPKYTARFPSGRAAGPARAGVDGDLLPTSRAGSRFSEPLPQHQPTRPRHRHRPASNPTSHRGAIWRHCDTRESELLNVFFNTLPLGVAAAIDPALITAVVFMLSRQTQASVGCVSDRRLWDQHDRRRDGSIRAQGRGSQQEQLRTAGDRDRCRRALIALCRARWDGTVGAAPGTRADVPLEARRRPPRKRQGRARHRSGGRGQVDHPGDGRD